MIARVKEKDRLKFCKKYSKIYKNIDNLIIDSYNNIIIIVFEKTYIIDRRDLYVWRMD